MILHVHSLSGDISCCLNKRPANSEVRVSFIMKHLFVIAFALVTVCSGALGQPQCGVSTGDANYVLRGDDAAPFEFPWQISIQNPDYLQYSGKWVPNCGGSIIDKNWILTAAHCVETQPGDDPKIRVVIGAHDITRYGELVSVQELVRTRDIWIHPMYDTERIEYDVALIQLPTPLDFAGKHSHIAPICMPMANESKVFEDMDCMVTGWGRTVNSENKDYNSKILQKLPVHVSRQAECMRAWSDTINGVYRITPRHICAATTRGEGSGVCYGDSGGPLQCYRNGRWVLVGVADFVRYCGASYTPNVFARVTASLDWIEAVRAARTRVV
ncbi:chymotrypsin elastase family member 3B-like [Tropilaelaps mercedesae]|uniref:Chymotrypsin elastase family member 3B-like n=1 Tax=Tropilaelaps mercedesae TaxID=418985 RepID=A0A1V9XEM2_9ACAR|nr:chymotrypsin elastase family member 3B-like [Tropilaelaps mercedesae]